jgi:fructokinase
VSTTRSKPIGAIEAGGTKFICAVGDGQTGAIVAKMSVPTLDDPNITLTGALDWLAEQQRQFGPLQALGIASFGPIDVHLGSPTYGFITSTPKPGWQNTDFVGAVKRRFPDIPIGFDTDVNGAALGEFRWGAGRGLSDFIYLTIGTGIGGGGMANGRLMHGLVHPEMGHMRLARSSDDHWPGVCPFHGDCWEGLCCGPAMQQRFGVAPDELPADHPGWDLETTYVAQALASLACILSPQRIIVGGSIRKAGRLGEDRFFQALRAKTLQALNGYIASPAITEAIDHYIVPPELGDEAGVRGALALGALALS